MKRDLYEVDKFFADLTNFCRVDKALSMRARTHTHTQKHTHTRRVEHIFVTFLAHELISMCDMTHPHV